MIFELTLYWDERVVKFGLNWPCIETRGSLFLILTLYWDERVVVLDFDLVLRREGRCSWFWPCTETRGSLFLILTLYWDERVVLKNVKLRSWLCLRSYIIYLKSIPWPCLRDWVDGHHVNAKIKSWNLNSVRRLQLKSETKILTMSKIVHHHLKSNLGTVLLKLCNRIVEVICKRTPCERLK